MKKGCFIKSIIFLTIIIAVVLYIIQHKFDEFVFSPGKAAAKEIFKVQWEEDLAFVRESDQKDSLKLILENYIDQLKWTDLEEENNQYLIDKAETIFSDSVITSQEIDKIIEIIENIKNERSEKN